MEENKKVAVLASFNNKTQCTNWKGYKIAFETRFKNFKHFDACEETPEKILNQVIEYKPDYYFILLYLGLKQDLKRLKDGCPNCKIILHYQDYNLRPEILALPASKYLDIMFLSNKDQIPKYKELLGLDKIFYMLSGCYVPTEQATINPEYKDKIIFIGRILNNPDLAHIHGYRSKFYHSIKQHLGDRLVNINESVFPARGNVYDRMPELYSSAQYSLSIDHWLPEIDGFTSNRIWTILILGGLPIIQRWKGMEDFGFIDKVNCFIFDPWDVKQFLDILKYADNLSEEERKIIRGRANKLGLERHTHHNRLESMMEIIGEEL